MQRVELGTSSGERIMAAEKTDAMILRVVDFSETSAIVTLWTRDFGKIGALAKGAKRPKSPFEFALDLLAQCKVVFLPRSNDALALLTEAKLERRFRGAERGVAALHAGYYVAELLRELTDPDDPQPELYDAAVRAVDALSGDAPPARTLLRFEMEMLRLLGHAPSLTRCAETGAPVPLERRVPFALQAGGVLLPQRRAGKSHIIDVSGQAVRTLDVYSRPDDEWKSTPVDRRLFHDVRAILNPYVSHLLGHSPRMHQHLGVVAEPPAPQPASATRAGDRP